MDKRQEMESFAHEMEYAGISTDDYTLRVVGKEFVLELMPSFDEAKRSTVEALRRTFLKH